jgi:hypothetical protein
MIAEGRRSLGMRALIAAVALTIFAPVSLADPQADAKIVAEAMMAEETIGASFAVLSNLMVLSLQGEIAKTGRKLNDESAAYLSGRITAELLPEMTSALKVELARIYVDKMSPESLAALSLFLQSEAGKEWLHMQPEIMIELSSVSQRIAEPLGRRIGPKVIGEIQAGTFTEGTPDSVKVELSRVFGKSKAPV